jgi:hypothetical protein
MHTINTIATPLREALTERFPGHQWSLILPGPVQLMVHTNHGGYDVISNVSLDVDSPRTTKEFVEKVVAAFTRQLGERTLDFGQALTALKRGAKVARKGWNGQGMHAFLQKGYPDGIPLNKNTAEASGIPEGTTCKFRPYFMLLTAQGDFAHWVPSSSDILADDWTIVGSC